MEQLSIYSNTSALLKPAHALSGDLAALLRDGRVLAGQVVESKEGGHVVVAVGRHRVPTQSKTELQVGDRFLFRVEGGADRPGLRVLDGERRPVPALLDALRQVVAADRPRGELLVELTARLAPEGSSARSESMGQLTTLIRSLGFKPGMTGEALAALLEASGTRHEAALLELSLLGSTDRNRGQLVSDLALLIAERASVTRITMSSSQGSGGFLRPFVEAIDAVLARVFLRGGSGADAALLANDSAFTRFVSSLAGELAGAVRKQTVRDPRAAQVRADLISGLGAMEARGLQSGPLTQLIRRLLGESWSPERVARAVREARGNLKSVLLGALASVEGDLKSVVERTLSNLESEQLKNLARSENGDPRHWSVPIPDGDRWATAQLFVQPDATHGTEEQEGSRRFVLGVDLSALGPVRADVVMRAKTVAVRVVVTRPEVAEPLRAALNDVGERLAIGGRKLIVHVIVGSLEAASVEKLERDISLLSEQHLMDVQG